MLLPIRLALISLSTAFGPRQPVTFAFLRILVSEECRAEKKLLYLLLQPRGQVGGILEFSHTIVPDGHKDDAWIAYGPIYSVLDETNDAEHPAGQDHPGIGRSLMECQRVNRIAVLPLCAWDKTPVIGRETVKARSFGSYSSLMLEPRGVSTTICISPFLP